MLSRKTELLTTAVIGDTVYVTEKVLRTCD